MVARGQSFEDIQKESYESFKRLSTSAERRVSDKESELGFFSVDSDQESMLGYMIYQDIIAEAPELKTEFAVQEDPTGDSNFRRVFEIAEHSRLPQSSLKYKTFNALCKELRRRSLEAFLLC